MCSRAPVSSVNGTSRATQTDSAAAGIPRNPSRFDVTPSRITAPAASETSSECSITGRSSDRQYSITWRVSRAVAIGFPSSETATMPASFIAAISAIASPWLPTLAAPIGHTRVAPAVRALSKINRVIDALSCTGLVFGMQHTAVNPPRAADFVPDSMVSEDSWPGSRKCTCRSIKPGATIIPLASNTSASRNPANFPGAPTSLTTSPSSNTSIAASVFDPGSITRPFLISNILGVLALWNLWNWILRTAIGGSPIVRRICMRRRMRAVPRVTSSQQIQNGHAHRHSVGHLFQHARLWSVGDFRSDFDAAIHWPRMQHQSIGSGTLQPFRIQLISVTVIVRGNGRVVLTLGLNAQHDDHVGVLQRFFNFVHAADHRTRRDFFQFSRHPHRRPAHSKLTAEFSQQMNIGTCHA